LLVQLFEIAERKYNTCGYGSITFLARWTGFITIPVAPKAVI
jgi:hypothetical protein